MSGPNNGSSVTPIINSTPRWIMRCTRMPSMSSCLISSKTRRTESSSSRFSRTAPTSVLCTTCSDLSFRATGKPIDWASFTASSRFFARPPATWGIPKAASTARTSSEDNHPAPCFSRARATVCAAASFRTSGKPGTIASGLDRHSA